MTGTRPMTTRDGDLTWHDGLSLSVRLIGWQAAGGIAAQVADVSVSDQVDLILGTGEPEPEPADPQADAEQ